MLDCRPVRARRLATAVIVAICLGGPIVEMFDRWDHTLQDGNDTEANVVVVAMCVGVALAVATTIIVARLRALSSGSCFGLVPCPSSILSPNRITTPTPAISPPTPLRV